MVRAIRIFKFLVVIFFALTASLRAQTSTDAVANASDEAWKAVPTKEQLMERFRKRDAAFGDYLIEFDVTRSKKRNPFGEWQSTTWKMRPRPKPPENLDPPHLETLVQRFLFATHAEEEHMDWHIIEVRKDGKRDGKSGRIGKGARYSTWGNTVRSEYYSPGQKLPEKVHRGDPRVPQVHKGSSSVPPTILDSNRLYYELCAGIGMGKRVQRIQKIERKNDLLHVAGEMQVFGRDDVPFEMDLAASLLPRRVAISFPQVVEPNEMKTRRKMVVETEGKLSHEFAPTTPRSAKFEYTIAIDPVKKKAWVRTAEKFDELRFIAARGQLGLDEFIKMARLESTSDF